MNCSFASKDNELVTYTTKYSRKLSACLYLAGLSRKKIVDEDIKIAAKKFEITFNSLLSAWKTFQESGGKYIDYRVTAQCYGAKFKAKPSIVCRESSRSVSTKEAAAIIVEYMTDRDIKSRELCNKYKISVPQFYSWIRELNVHGTLFGKKVLDPSKYAKLVVKDVIWFRKRPETSRASIVNLSITEKAAYNRVAEVLLRYLPTL